MLAFPSNATHANSYCDSTCVHCTRARMSNILNPYMFARSMFVFASLFFQSKR